MQERIKAFRDIAALIRTRAQALDGGITACALQSVASDIERHADGMAADQQANALPADEKEKRARDLYERVSRKLGAPTDWNALPAGGREWYRYAVDVIGEIERERTANVKASLGAPTNDPADNWIAWRGSASDFVTDMKAAIPPVKLTAIKAMIGAFDEVREPLTEAEADALATRLIDAHHGHETALHAALTRVLRGDIPPEVRPLKPGERPGDGAFTTNETTEWAETAEHPRDHVEDEGTALVYGTWQPDPLAPDPEDGTLCGGCRAPRNAIHSPFCPTRAGLAVGRVSAEMAVTTGEPRHPFAEAAGVCGARLDGFTCTADEGHDGDHVAHGSDIMGLPETRWSRKPEPMGPAKDGAP